MTQKLVGNIFQHNVDVRTHFPSDSFVNPALKIGLEVELEEFPAPEDINQDIYWNKDYDDSLRGDHKTELVLAQPLNGLDLDNAIHSLENMIITSDYQPVLSSRTSTHVHMDATGLSLNALRKWILNYIIFERALFKYCGRVRERSPFCVPLYKAESVLPSLGAMYDDCTNLPHRLGKYVGDETRYGAINLHALFKWGTLEFRMLPAKWKHSQIVEWLNILMSIRDYAINSDLDMDYVYKFVYDNNPISYLEEVFGDYASLLMYEGVEEDLIKGIRLARNYASDELKEAPIFWSVIEITQKVNWDNKAYDNFVEKHKDKPKGTKAKNKKSAKVTSSYGKPWWDTPLHETPPPTANLEAQVESLKKAHEEDFVKYAAQFIAPSSIPKGVTKAGDTILKSPIDPKVEPIEFFDDDIHIDEPDEEGDLL